MYHTTKTQTMGGEHIHEPGYFPRCLPRRVVPVTLIQRTDMIMIVEVLVISEEEGRVTGQA